jgi:hypothetical protein
MYSAQFHTSRCTTLISVFNCCHAVYKSLLSWKETSNCRLGIISTHTMRAGNVQISVCQKAELRALIASHLTHDSWPPLCLLYSTDSGKILCQGCTAQTRSCWANYDPRRPSITASNFTWSTNRTSLLCQNRSTVSNSGSINCLTNELSLTSCQSFG